jgi:UDP-GlcNAc:undecaprenyl-phosphate GlcNAc-1-phosphate transferase
LIRIADLFPVILVSILTALLSGPFLIRLAVRFGLLDQPGSQPHKWHSEPTPMAGGAILALAILVSILTVAPRPDRTVIGILIAAGIVFLWGLWDDRKTLPAWLKLLGQLLAAFVLWRSGVMVKILPLEGLNVFVTFFWAVGIVNAFNFVDSMDGLALGLAAIASAFFVLVTLDAQQPQLAFLAVAVLGATIGTFFFNAAPAKTFIGDSGSQLLGILLAGIGVAYNPVGLQPTVSWFMPILVLGIPIFNMTLVVSSRLIRRRKVYQAHKDHISHRLVHLGLDRTRTVLAIQLTAIVLGLVAFIALGGTPLTANLVYGAVVLAGVIVIAILEKTYPPEASLGGDGAPASAGEGGAGPGNSK